MAQKTLHLLGLIILIYASVFFAVKLGWTNVSGIVDNGNLASVDSQTKPGWIASEEWQTLKVAIQKDEAVITQAAKAANIPPRLIVALIVPEQLRLFNDEREIFKQIFLPLKILGNQTQFSWGVAGLKPETAEQIEQRLPATDKALLAFTSENHDQERFARITDEHNHYYSYLYVALYVKEISTEWREAGFDISDRPEILATLYNIGFANSIPKPNPQMGGAEISLAGLSYSFGRLAGEFYYSKELVREFPPTSSRPSSLVE